MKEEMKRNLLMNLFVKFKMEILPNMRNSRTKRWQTLNFADQCFERRHVGTSHQRF